MLLDKAGRGGDELRSRINDPKLLCLPGQPVEDIVQGGVIWFMLVKQHSVSLLGKDCRKPEHPAILRVGDSCGGLPGTVREVTGGRHVGVLYLS